MRVRTGRRSAVVVAILATALILTAAGSASLAAWQPPGLKAFMAAVGKVESGGRYTARNPVSGAYVLSRGIVGSRGGVPTVASPLHKQVYDLRSGDCLDLPGVTVRRHDVRCRDGLVEVRLRQEG